MWTRFGDKLLCDTRACNAELDRLRAEARNAAAAQQVSVGARIGRSGSEAVARQGAPRAVEAVQRRFVTARPRG